MITVYCVTGRTEHLSDPEEPVGMLSNTTDQLDPPQFRVLYVPYPASFGPIDGDLSAPSYAESETTAVQAAEEMIAQNPGKFVLVGYSEGAEAVVRVAYDLQTPGHALHDRLPDLLQGYTFGPPCRPHGHSTENDLEFPGHLRFPACPAGEVVELLFPRGHVRQREPGQLPAARLRDPDQAAVPRPHRLRQPDPRDAPNRGAAGAVGPQ